LNFEEKTSLEKKSNFFLAYATPSDTHGYPQKMSVNLVQPFGQLQLTYKYILFQDNGLKRIGQAQMDGHLKLRL